MRPMIAILSFLAVIALGTWAYRENYATQQVLRDVDGLNAEIAALREALAVQRAEWAYLNRPDRLRELATINFDSLGLLPMEPGQFGQASQIAYPPAALPQLSGGVDVSGSLVPHDPGKDGQFP